MTVGVIGGMGPAATADFHRLLVEATPAARDQDHIHVVIDSNPAVPDRQDALLRGGPSPAPFLVDAARRLQAMGADLLVMPCNTAHAWVREIREAVVIPILSIIDVTVEATRDRHPGVSRVGLLATTGCLAAGLYQDAFGAAEVECLLLPSDLQDRFTLAIAATKGPGIDASTKREMAELGAVLVAAGAEVLIAGCTEVPLLMAPQDAAVPLVSSTHVLAARTAARAVTS